HQLYDPPTRGTQARRYGRWRSTTIRSRRTHAFSSVAVPIIPAQNPSGGSTRPDRGRDRAGPEIYRNRAGFICAETLKWSLGDRGKAPGTIARTVGTLRPNFADVG